MKKLLVKYKLSYTKNAFRDVKKLDLIVKKKIKRKIELYSKRPILYAKKLVGKFLGSYRWRIGNHRVIFDLKEKEIIILKVGHRKEIYR